MMRREATYLGELELSEATLAHYGVKGMKWGRRKKTTTKRKYQHRGNIKEEYRKGAGNDLSNEYYNQKYVSEDVRIPTFHGGTTVYSGGKSGRNSRGVAPKNQVYRDLVTSHIDYVQRERNGMYDRDTQNKRIEFKDTYTNGRRKKKQANKR